MKEVRVRFAPSPTGNLHIGGARTAIFNYLLAKKMGGKFLLRIENTDTQRSKPEYEVEILEAMAWLGLTPDEEPLRQTSQLTLHREASEELLDRGKAYKCFLSVEEAKLIKDRARETGDTNAFRSPHRYLTKEEVEARTALGEKYTIRFKVEGESIRYEDGVHGVVEVPTHSIDDFIVQRSDGTPTYMMAVVVDDHDMAVTHVIRGDDHISNTPKQIMIYEALGIKPPQFAHVPLILGEGKKRLSKRHGATAVTEYKEMGYLPESVLCFLTLLGWSPGNEEEIFTFDELVKLFDVSGINNKSAVFDLRKLEWMNGEFITRMPNIELEKELRPYVAEKIATDEFPAGSGKMLPLAVKLLKSRVHFPKDIIDLGFYFFKDPDTIIDKKSAKKRLKDPDTPEFLEELAVKFEAVEEFNEENIEAALRSLAEELEIGTGKLIHPTRLAVSAQGVGPGLFELLVALTKETVIRRMRWLAEFLRDHGTPPDLEEVN
jgi:glutamyl-tRNA synthetase